MSLYFLGKGYAGGSFYNDNGAASEYVCLPSDPQWGQFAEQPDTYIQHMFGAEYESNAGHSPFGPNSHNEDVPCAVCRARSFSSSIMIPARTHCYTGWTEAFRGTLASGYYDHRAASEFVCVDEHTQALPGGANRNDDGKLFVGVKAYCGSLRCPPYQENRFLSCVVCMQ